MGYKSFFRVFLFSFLFQAVSAQNTETVQTFSWITGVWELMPDEPTVGQRFFEQWVLLNDNTLLGKSFSVNQRYTDIPPDTLVSENIVLSFENEEVYYTPTVYGQNENEPIPFKLEKDSLGQYIFVNETHDFPQQIIYKPIGEDSLVVILYGITEGTELEQEFHFKKKETYFGDLKQYFFVMLTKGEDRTQDVETAAKIQMAHLANIQRLSEEGVIKLSGSFLEDIDWQGIFIFNCGTKAEVEAYLQSDPAVQAKRLGYSILPWGTGIDALK